MRKTYYTIDYAIMGRDKATAYFDNKKLANIFYNTGDYRDEPKAHRISNPDKIKMYDELVGETNAELCGWLI